MDKSLSLPFDFDIDIDLTIMHPSELKMEMESAIEDAVETAEDILVRMQMMEPERMVEQYCQSINETATESAKTVKNGVLNIFSKILTNVLNEEQQGSSANSGSGADDNELALYEGQNPLMIDLVLRTVMQYLSTQHLCVCRLVCKLWNVEAGAYIRRKNRIVFSPNSIEKMANFTAFMKAQLEENEDMESLEAAVGDNEDGGDYNDNFDKSHHHQQQQHLNHHDSQDNSSIASSDNFQGESRRGLLPAYSDFSFTAQFPQINFSRKVVQDFSLVYGQYVKKLEIFYPNDSSLTAKDFRQFFLKGMPNVQYIHFVNLPTKLTQSSFLTRMTADEIGKANNNTRLCSNSSSSRFKRSPSSSSIAEKEDEETNNSIMIKRNNNTIKDSNNLTRYYNINKKDNEDNEPSHYQDNDKNDNNAEEGDLEEEEEELLKLEKIRLVDNDEDCYSFPKWNSLAHLKIDRTLLIEVAWSKPFLEDLFRTMPNLKHYELWTWNTTGGDVHSNPYFTCLTQSQRENLVSLYPGSVGENLLMSLADYGLNKLKKLHLPVFSGEVSAQSVELLLSNLKGTLEELQVNCSSMQDSRMIHFPRMEKLLVLHMIISVPWKNVYTLFTPSIEYQNQFPVLETLKLELAVYHDFGFIHYFFPGNGSVCETLKELDISFSGYRDDKFIGIVARIFPNLIKLRLDGYGNRILAGICLYLQNLEHFEMFLIYGFNVDDQLTGIDRKICNEIRKCERYLDFKMDEQTQMLPSLANLSKLKTLKIKQKDYQAKYWPQAQCITDITGYFSLAKITTLRHLHIESVKFSPECRQYLAATLEDCWLDFL